jgi:hypothetical protein
MPHEAWNAKVADAAICVLYIQGIRPTAKLFAGENAAIAEKDLAHGRRESVSNLWQL